MTLLASNAYLAVVVPLAIAAVIGLGGRWLKGASPWLALLGPVLVLATGVAHPLSGGEVTHGMTEWLQAGDAVLDIGWRLDGLAAVMLMVVGLVASAVVVFSVGYMHGDRGYARYFALLSLFTAAMAGLVLSSSLVGLFAGWELVGACSFLLIGFWYDKPSAAQAARKAFLVTRVGDVGFLMGIAVLWQATGTLSIDEMLAGLGGLPSATVTLAALLLFMGAAGKSAQFPLHVWLPDAMEGPTPVSALIHAATMVAAGVFLLARTWPLFEASQAALDVVLAVGTFTAIAAATIAVAQSDIKKVLAYSTISQLGFMFAALGAGAWGAAMLHLVMHAAFKALLFLAAGSVIHGAGTQELGMMGGLRREMPLTTAFWLAGALALAGIPPLAGFWSKDAVLASVLHSSPTAFYVLLAASLLTGLYVGRTTRLAFFGTYRGKSHPHESGAVMTGPLAVLAIAAVGGGAAVAWLEHLLGLEPETFQPLVAGLALAAGVIGLAVGWWVWSRDPAAERSFAASLRAAWSAVGAGYGYDRWLTRVFVGPTVAAARGLHAIADRGALDGTVENTGRSAQVIGAWMTRLQNGDGQAYATLIGIGAMVLLAIAVWVGR